MHTSEDGSEHNAILGLRRQHTKARSPTHTTSNVTPATATTSTTATTIMAKTGLSKVLRAATMIAKLAAMLMLDKRLGDRVGADTHFAYREQWREAALIDDRHAISKDAIVNLCTPKLKLEHKYSEDDRHVHDENVIKQNGGGSKGAKVNLQDRVVIASVILLNLGHRLALKRQTLDTA